VKVVEHGRQPPGCTAREHVNGNRGPDALLGHEPLEVVDPADRQPVDAHDANVNCGWVGERGRQRHGFFPILHAPAIVGEFASYSAGFSPTTRTRGMNGPKPWLARVHFVALAPRGGECDVHPYSQPFVTRTRLAAMSATFVPYSQPFVAVTPRRRTSATKCCLASPPSRG
jgi:hypothetical protein